MNSLNIKQLTTALIGSFILVSVFSVLDALLENDGSDQDSKVESLLVDIPENSAKSVDYESLYARFEVLQPTEKVEEVNTTVAAQQAPTEPVVDKTLRPNFLAFDDNHQVGLVGIVRKPEKFAVLQLVNFASGQVSFKKVREGQNYGPYVIKNITDLTVQLKSDGLDIKLALFNAKKSV